MQQGEVYRRGDGCPGTWKDDETTTLGHRHPVRGGKHHFEARRKEEPDEVCSAEVVYWCRSCGCVVAELPA